MFLARRAYLDGKGDGIVSVAFRRESDEEHREPRFELPIPPGPNPVTRRGLALIEARVAGLEAEVRALPEGDARGGAARDLRYWRQRLATAEVMPPHRGEEAGFGARVRFRHHGRERTLAIVGHDEAGTAPDLAAFTAPLARALTGAAAGDLVAFGGRPDAIEVLEVAADRDGDATG